MLFIRPFKSKDTDKQVKGKKKAFYETEFLKNINEIGKSFLN